MVVSLAQGLKSPSSIPTQVIFHLVFHLLPTSPTSPPSCDWVPWHLLGCKFKAFSHETAMVQVGFEGFHTTCCEEKGLFSCEFLAWLQELCLHDSLCLLIAQASWLCQVCITASGCKRENFLYVCAVSYYYYSKHESGSCNFHHLFAKVHTKRVKGDIVRNKDEY